MTFLELTSSETQFILEEGDGNKELEAIYNFRTKVLTSDKRYVRITIEATNLYWHVTTIQLQIQTGHNSGRVEREFNIKKEMKFKDLLNFLGDKL